MGRRGPKPKPTVIKRLQGNPGHRPLPKDEPTAEPLDSDSIPDFLSKEAKKEWARVVELLASLSMLTEQDRPTLIAYCSAYGDFVEASKLIQKHGNFVMNARTKKLEVNAARKIADAASDRMTKLGAHFGFSPSSRAGINAPAATPKEPTSGFDAVKDKIVKFSEKEA